MSELLPEPLSSPSVECTEVLIIGAGIAGLAAAQVLRNQGISCIVLEARQRIGGRIHSITLPGSSTQTGEVVDLGANYLHGCVNKQTVQPLFRMAQLLDMECAVTVGDLVRAYRGWDNPQVALWRDLGDDKKTKTSKRISPKARNALSLAKNPSTEYRQRFPRRSAPLAFTADGHVITSDTKPSADIADQDAKKLTLDVPGSIIPPDMVANMVFLLDRCIVTLLTLNQLDEDLLLKKTLEEQFQRALTLSLEILHRAGRRSSAVLNRQENGVLASLRAKFLCYVRAASDLPCTYPKSVEYQRCAQQGSAYRADFPQLHHYQGYMAGMEEKREAFAAQRDGLTPRREALGEKGAQMRIHSSGEDRLVLSGFQRITDCLAQNVDIRLGHVVRCILWQKDDSQNEVSPNEPHPSSHGGSVNTEYSEANTSSSSSVALDSSNCNDDYGECVTVHNSTVVVAVEEQQLQNPGHVVQRHFHSRYCLVTLPVGVLAGLHDASRVQFHPPLPPHKTAAIARLAPSSFGQPTHDKIILQFRAPQDLFWDLDWPQLNATDPRVHLLNLHVYGKVGVLLAHLWAGSGWTLANKSDAQVVEELMSLLERMYPKQADCRGGKLPRPIHYVVTRWGEDPFSLAAYTEGGLECVGDEDRATYRASLPNEENPQVLFAGEASVLSTEMGQQCTHGAFLTGVQRAVQIARHFVGSCRLSKERVVEQLVLPRHHQQHLAKMHFSEARAAMHRKRRLRAGHVERTIMRRPRSTRRLVLEQRKGNSPSIPPRSCQSQHSEGKHRQRNNSSNCAVSSTSQ